MDVPYGDYVVLFLDAGGLVMEDATVVVPTLTAAVERVKDSAPVVGAAGWRVFRCVARSEDKERW